MPPESAATPSAPAAGASIDEVADHLADILDAEEPEETGQETEQDEAPASGEDGEESADGPEEKTEEPPQTFRVKVRGEEHEVPLQELLDGYSRTQDYKAKTAEVAEQRRQLDAALEGERQQLKARLGEVTNLLVNFDPILAQGAQIDWTKLAQENPSEYTRSRAIYEQRLNAVRGAQAQMGALQQQELQKRTLQEKSAMEEKMPELARSFADPGFRDSFVRSAKDFYGVEAAELATVIDHRQLGILADAIKYRQGLKAKDGIKDKKVTTVPQYQKPGSSAPAKPAQSQRAAALKSRAIRSGRESDAVEAAMAILGSR